MEVEPTLDQRPTMLHASFNPSDILLFSHTSSSSFPLIGILIHPTMSDTTQVSSLEDPQLHKRLVEAGLSDADKVYVYFLKNLDHDEVCHHCIHDLADVVSL